VREYCYVDFNAGRVLFQKVTPERVDAIYDALVASNGGSKPEFIDEYRKYIIRELALKSQSNPSYAQMDIEYDWPEVTVPVYPEFAAEQMESIKAKRAADEKRKARDAMNAKYKKVIDEISSCRTDLS
jgi:FKBP-type peptidyl-prolyl cis-trans isomerase (trigger factor)